MAEIANSSKLRIDDFVEHINSIYERDNSDKSYKDIIISFWEDLSRCNQLINRDRETEVKEQLPLLFKWFCILFSKFNSQNRLSLRKTLWNKFPDLCPYCMKRVCKCKHIKKIINVPVISDMADTTITNAPESISDWQELFQRIYPRYGGNDTKEIRYNISRLEEEFGELSEAYRKPYVKKYTPIIELEFADVFSWLMGTANALDFKLSNGYSLEAVLLQKFKSGCPECIEERKMYNKMHCLCSLKEQKLRLISDYDPVQEEPVINNPIHTEQSYELENGHKV